MKTWKWCQTAALVLCAAALGCGKAQPKQEPQATEEPPATEKPIDTVPAAKTTDHVDAGSEIVGVNGNLSEADIARAKQQSERVWKQYGTQIIARIVEQQLIIFRDSMAKITTAMEAKRWNDAQADLEKLLDENKPNDPRLWIALATVAVAKGDNALAERAAVHALWRQFDLRVRAQALTLLGTLAEKRGDKLRAALYYRQATVARPDKDLEAKAKKLDPAGAKAELPDLIGLLPAPIGPAKDIDALCKLLDPAFPAPASAANQCTRQTRWTARASSGALEEATIVTLTSGKTDSHELLALKGPKGWVAVSVLAYDSKLVNLWAEADVFEVMSIQFQQVVTGGPEELVIKYKHRMNDCDPSINERQVLERKMLEVWSLDGERLKNPLRIPYAMTLSHTLANESFNTTLAKDVHSVPALPIQVAYELEVGFGPDGQLKAEAKSGAIPPELQSLIKPAKPAKPAK